MKWFLVRGAFGLYRLFLLPLISGARTKVIHISDIDHSTCPRHINVKSDVFAVFQRNVCTDFTRFGFFSYSCFLQHLVYAGERNGSIERFDTRMASHQGQKLFDIRFGESPRSSVLYLNTIREYELLLSHLNGDVGVAPFAWMFHS